MQRVRIGITGLAVVFLIVLLAAAIVGFHSKERNGEANLVAESENVGRRSSGCGRLHPRAPRRAYRSRAGKAANPLRYAAATARTCAGSAPDL